jgi:uncharacterized protein (TIGR02172 family)
MEKGKLIGIGRTAEIFEYGKNKVLKLYMDWCPETWIIHEESVTRLCHEAGLLVPKTFGLVDVDNRKGLILERIEGRTMMQIIDEKLATNPELLLQYAKTMAEVHAIIHNYQNPRIQELQSQMAMIRNAIVRTDALSEPLRNKALAAMEGLPDGDVVCHYDFHPGNIMMSPNGPVLIDWITGSRGNPYADIARTLIIIGFGSPPDEVMPKAEFEILRKRLIDTYLAEYSKLRKLDLEQLEAWRVPIAAARLNENIKECEEWLLGIVEEGA